MVKHCCGWMRRPWRPLCPLLAFSLSFFTRYGTWLDKGTEVRIIHEVSTEARPVHEAVNAETVGEASSAPKVDKKRWEPIYTSKGPVTVTNIISFYMKTARGVEGEGFANFVHVVLYCKLFFLQSGQLWKIQTITKETILYIGNLLAMRSLQHRQVNTDIFLR